MTDMHDLLAAYALHALDREERESFEVHLRECSRCQDEMEAFQASAVALAEAVATNPPPHLKGKVMATVTGKGAQVTALPRLRRPRFGLALAGVAAVAALVFGGLWVTSTARLAQSQLIAAVYTASDSIVVNLESSVGRARFVYSPSLEQGVFTGADLVLPDADRVYELWLVGPGNPAPAGTFRPGAPAAATVLVEGVEPGLVLAMTEEPAGGSPLPTGDVLLSAGL